MAFTKDEIAAVAGCENFNVSRFWRPGEDGSWHG